MLGQTTTATKVVRATKTLLGALLVIWGTSMAVPRLRHNFEELKGECRLSSGTVARFYLGNVGFGHGYGYYVYVQPGGPWTEELVFSSYRTPAVKNLKCERTALEIVGYAETWWLDASAPPSQVAESLRGQLDLHAGSAGLAYIDRLRIVFGGFVAALGVAFIVWYSRRRVAPPYASEDDDFGIAVATLFDLPNVTTRRFTWFLLPLASAITCPFVASRVPHADFAVTGPLLISVLCYFIGLAPRAITTIVLGSLSGVLMSIFPVLTGTWMTGSSAADFGHSIAIPASFIGVHYALTYRAARAKRRTLRV
jgi:hypothetical protein